jgi:steroid delta-isomerase-like uncharacterized protein
VAATVDTRAALSTAYVDAWNAHDPAAVTAFFAEDAVYDDRGAGTVARGRPAIRAHVEAVVQAFADLHFDVRRTAFGEDFVAAEWSVTMTHTGEFDGLAPTGRTLTSAGVDVATLNPGDEITHLVSYYDGAEIMRGLALLPARHSAVERALLRAASAAGRLRSLARSR